MSEVKGRIEYSNPHWRVDSSGELARRVRGVCGITQDAAEQLVAELLESEDGTVQFQTKTALVGHPKSMTVSQWAIREVTWKGISVHTGFVLERKDRK